MGFGIDRVPKDVDAYREMMAELEADGRIQRRKRRGGRVCMRCGAPAEMSASLGPSCLDCYDVLSD